MKKLLYVALLLVAAAIYAQVTGLLTATAPSARPAATVKARSASRSPQGTADGAAVVAAAQAFLASLSPAERNTAVRPRDATSVTRWSNLPAVVPGVVRNGLRFRDLTAPQVALALTVVRAASGTAPNEGYDEALQIRASDDVLGAIGSGGGGTGGSGSAGYSSELYVIAFLGEPNLTGTWQLQFGGHHLALNTTYKNGVVAGATPLFEGVEPASFSVGSGATIPAGTYAPLSSEIAAMRAMLGSNDLTAAQLAAARITQTFNDVLLGPTANGAFPATKVGLRVGSLSAAQQARVLAAMVPWVQDTDDATAASLLAIYQRQLADTYIAYSGTTALINQTDYVRIDGPHVWIELVGQSGRVLPGVHYHSVWRDHARDYGGDYYTTVVLSTKEKVASQMFSVYPSPTAASKILRVQLARPATRATYVLRNTLGQTLATRQFKGTVTEVPTAGLAPGTYLLSLQTDGGDWVVHRFSAE